MSDVTIVSDLQGLCKLKVEKGETQEAFAERLARKAFGVAEGDWETLTEASQEWVNNTMLAVDAKKSFPMPSGIEDVVEHSDEKDAGHPAGDKEEAAETSAKKKKASPKKAVAKAPEKPAKAAAPKKATAKAPAKKVAKSNGGGKTQTGPKGRFGLEDKIKILVKGNPFREGTKCAAWFDLLKDGMTVEAAIAGGVPRHHIRWEQTLEHVKIG